MVYINPYKVIDGLSDESILWLSEKMQIAQDRQAVKDEIKRTSDVLWNNNDENDGQKERPTNIEYWFEFIELCFNFLDGEPEWESLTAKEQMIYDNLKKRMRKVNEMKSAAFLNIADDLVAICRDFMYVMNALRTREHRDYLKREDLDVDILLMFLGSREEELEKSNNEYRSKMSNKLTNKLKMSKVGVVAIATGTITAALSKKLLSKKWLACAGGMAAMILTQKKSESIVNKGMRECEASDKAMAYMAHLLVFGRNFTMLMCSLRKDILNFD